MPLDATRWKLAEELFHQLLATPPEQRERELLPLDAELRGEVVALIDGFEASEAHRVNASAKSTESPAAVQSIGPYTVIKQLGEGGMGTVYLAERADAQYHKQVAIKLIRPGPGSYALMQRFYTERQILSGMEHPNIARMLEGGVIENAQPYLVMEYVDGERFDKYCDARQLGVRERLELFAKVCGAVNYAHQSLIVHRDLKPNNIMVSREGEPKLLDFGVAKAFQPSSENSSNRSDSELTATIGLFFTPLYASPELLRGQHTTVSTDVYSLGVILYQLLTGRLPHDKYSLSPGELISAVMTADPLRPSTSAAQALEHEATPQELAARRGLTPQKLQRVLQGDLDGIVLKALAKDPKERYASVEQLNDDIARYLTGKPVLAVEGSTAYLVKKFISRHKTYVAAAALVLVSLLGGLAGTLWQARVARQQSAEATLRFNDARTLANYLLFDLYGSVKTLPGSTAVQAEMADRSLQYLDRLAAAKTRDQPLQLELARGYLQLGDVLSNPFEPNLGQTVKGLQAYQKALAMLEPMSARGVHDSPTQMLLAKAHQQMAGTLVFMGKSADGIPHARTAAQLFNNLIEADPMNAGLRLAGGLANQFLGRHILQQSGWFDETTEGDEASVSLSRSVQHLQIAIQLAPKQTRARLLLAATYQAMGNGKNTHAPRAAVAIYTKGLEVLDQLPDKDRSSLEVRNQRTAILQNVGWTEGQLKDYARCLAHLGEAKEVLAAISQADPKNLAALYHVAIVLRSLGIFHAYAGNLQAAIASYRDAISIYDRLVPADPVNEKYPMFRAEVQMRTAAVLVRTGQLADARQVGTQGLRVLDHLADQASARVQNLLDAMRWHEEIELAPLLDYTKVERYAQRADEITKGTNLDAIQGLAIAKGHTGRKAAAIADLKRGLALLSTESERANVADFRREMEAMLAEYSGKNVATASQK